MKFSFLPEEIKVEIDENLVEQEPLALARSNMAMDGNMGESFIVAYNERFYFFTKTMASPIYTKIEGVYSDLDSVKISKENKYSIIEIELQKKKHTFKFSPLEERNLNKVAGKWLTLSITPFEAFITSMIYLAAEDGTLADEENELILSIAGDNQVALEKANAFFQIQPVETLITILQDMDEEQAYCIVANLLELSVADGIAHSDEIKLIKRFAKAMDISSDEFSTVKQVIFMKNKISSLVPKE